MNRREFIRIALMSTALLAGADQLLDAEESASLSSDYGAMRFMAPGVIQPERWLRKYMEEQATELASNLPKISHPFNDQIHSRRFPSLGSYSDRCLELWRGA